MAQKPFFNQRYDQYGNLVGLRSLNIDGTKSPWVGNKLALRENRLNAFDKETINSQSISIREPNTPNWVARRSAYAYFSYIPAPFPGRYDTSVTDDAVVKAYSKLYDRVANVADILRTRKETASMVYNTVRQMLLAARKLRRGDIDGAFHYLRGEPRRSKYKRGDAFGQRWLEYSYGWSPLVQDVFNLLDQGFGALKLESRGVNKTYYFTESPRKIDPDFGAYSIKGFGTYTSKCTCKLFAEITNSSLGAISSWGLDNPAALAWEAMPYSFVIDWFIPVGDYLTMAMAFAGNGVTITSGSLTYSTVIDQQWTTSPRGSSGFTCNSTQSSRIVSLKTRELRVPSYPTPSFSHPFSPSARILNQLALLKLELSRRCS